MNIFMLLLTLIGGVSGLVSTLYIIVSMFVVIFYKIYRKTRYHISFYN